MEFVKHLGRGSYGTVDLYRFSEFNSSTFYAAVKTSNHKSIEREFQIMTKLKRFPRIVQVIGYHKYPGTDSNGKVIRKMSMEYAAGGNLTSFIKRNKCLSDATIKDFTRMILQGLVTIHNIGYVHCDLKPDNILLFPNYEKQSWECSYDLKISDFGLSIKEGQRSNCWDVDAPFVGTPSYMSPESVEYGSVEKTLDLWSLGCVVLEMYTGNYPWLGVSLNDIEGLLAQGNAPEIPNSVPCDARRFIETCFARNVEERGTASGLLKHSFLVGERKGMELRRRPTPAVETKTKLKVVSVKPPQFKKIVKKPQWIKINLPRPPVSGFGFFS